MTWHWPLGSCCGSTLAALGSHWSPRLLGILDWWGGSLSPLLVFHAVTRMQPQVSLGDWNLKLMSWYIVFPRYNIFFHFCNWAFVFKPFWKVYGSSLLKSLSRTEALSLSWKWKSLSCVQLFALHGLYTPWNSPGQNTGVGSLSLLHGIFSTQGSNPGLPHYRWILYKLSHKGGPRILEWVAYPFSNGSSWPRNRAEVSCIAGEFFTNWAMREAEGPSLIGPWTNGKLTLARTLLQA